MIKRLWIRIFLLLVGMSLIALSSTLILRELMINDFKQYIEGEAEDKVYQTIAMMEGIYERFSKWNEEMVAENIVNAYLNGLDVRLVDRDGKIIMDRQMVIKQLTPYMRKRVFAFSRLREEETLDGRAKNEGFISYPLFLMGKEIGALEVRFMRTNREEIFIKRSNRFMLLSLFSLGALSIILSIFFSRKLTEPINRLSSAADTIRSGNLNVRVTVTGVDEIARLSDTFNNMVIALQSQENLRKTLLSNIAHDMRTPLGVIRGELEGMIDDVIPVDKDQLQSLYEEIKRISRIVEGIEELSSAQASAMNLRRQNVLLKPFLEEITEYYRSSVRRGITIDVECNLELSLYADPERLSQIIINLLDNSLKAIESGGKIWLKAWKEDGYVIMEIGDTGIGIKKEDLPYIFERFFRRFKEGLGIGLSIVKELVEAHGGRIKVESEYGKGTVFTLSFPAHIHNSS